MIINNSAYKKKRLNISNKKEYNFVERKITYFREHNFSQIWNLAKYRVHKLKKFNTEYLRYDPLNLALFITNRCNIKCSPCPLVNSKNLSKNFTKTDDISMDRFRWIVNKFSKVLMIEITGGEPFLHNNIFEMIDYIHERKIKIKIPTNGTVIHNVLDKIVHSPISIFNISLNALSSQEYTQFTGVSEKVYNMLLKDISELVKERNRHNKNLRIKISYICTRANYKNIPKMVGVAENLGVDECIFHNLIPFDIPGFSKDQCLYDDDPEVIEVIRSVPSSKSNLEVVMPRLYKKKNLIDKRCKFPFDSLPIYTNGNVSPCSCHKAPPGNYGNVFTDEDVWNNSDFQRIREMLIDQSLPLPDYCKTCPCMVVEWRPSYVPNKNQIR